MPVLHFVIVFHFFVVRIFLGRSLFMYYYFSNYSFRKKKTKKQFVLCYAPCQLKWASLCVCVLDVGRSSQEKILSLSLQFHSISLNLSVHSQLKNFLFFVFDDFAQFFFFFIWIQNTKENNIFKMTFIHTTRQYTTHRCQHSIESTIK